VRSEIYLLVMSLNIRKSTIFQNLLYVTMPKPGIANGKSEAETTFLEITTEQLL
jgi:hypothetical protein